MLNGCYAANVGRTNFAIHEILGLASGATIPIGTSCSNVPCPDATITAAAAANCFGILPSVYCQSNAESGSNNFANPQQQQPGSGGTLSGQQINNLFTAGLELMPPTGMMNLPQEFATDIGYPEISQINLNENSMCCRIWPIRFDVNPSIQMLPQTIFYCAASTILKVVEAAPFMAESPTTVAPPLPNKLFSAAHQEVPMGVEDAMNWKQRHC